MQIRSLHNMLPIHEKLFFKQALLGQSEPNALKLCGWLKWI